MDIGSHKSLQANLEQKITTALSRFKILPDLPHIANVSDTL